MSFSQMFDLLKKKEKGNIVFVKIGTFYITVGEDAVLIHKKLKLKCTCYKKNICKVGFTVVAFDKYVEKLNETKYGYAIYDLNLEKTELKEIIYSNKGKKGLAIGNYTSQMFANIYLNEVDQYIKNKLHCKYYFRYLDDSIAMFKTKEEAKYMLEKIKNFLKCNLELELNEKTQIFKNKQRVNFCGYKINPYRLKIRDKRKKKTKEKSKRTKV